MPFLSFLSVVTHHSVMSNPAIDIALFFLHLSRHTCWKKCVYVVLHLFQNVEHQGGLYTLLLQAQEAWRVLLYRYAIDRYTDPDGQFAIDGNGLVTTAKLLDREDKPGHRVHILAIDKGLLTVSAI